VCPVQDRPAVYVTNIGETIAPFSPTFAKTFASRLISVSMRRWSVQSVPP
jgi:hypothetical protein